MYTKLGGDGETPGPFADSIDVTSKTFAGLLGAGYSVWQDGNSHLDIVAGARAVERRYGHLFQRRRAWRGHFSATARPGSTDWPAYAPDTTSTRIGISRAGASSAPARRISTGTLPGTGIPVQRQVVRGRRLSRTRRRLQQRRLRFRRRPAGGPIMGAVFHF